MKMCCSHWSNKELTGQKLGKRARLKECWEEEGRQSHHPDAEEAGHVEDEDVTSHEPNGST